MDKIPILVIDDELSMRQFLEILLKKDGYAVDTAENGDKALEIIKTKDYAVILMDYNMPEGIDGINLLNRLRHMKPSAQIIVITAYASTEQAIKAIEVGAVDYVSKPFNVAEIRDLVTRAVSEFKKSDPAHKEDPVLLVPQPTASVEQKQLVSASPAMQKVLHFVEQVAPSNSTVLITGESGVGKEVIARYVHDHSQRKTGPWYPINCGAIPENLQESELFGYEKGAFTGAFQTKKGYFETAVGGTLFLDEVGELSENMQVKLLRVLEDRSFMRVGGVEKLHADVRLIAATNKNLQREVTRGTFREDLFFRLNVFEIHIPPLRERREDVNVLINVFVSMLNHRFGRSVCIADEAREFLSAYHFPGNVRELHNIIERAFVLAKDETITSREIKVRSQHDAGAPDFRIEEPVDLDQILAGVEKKYIEGALQKAKWNRHETSILLGISERSLRYRMDKLGVRESE